MKERLCFVADEIIKLLPEYELKNFNTKVMTDSDYGDWHENRYYICLPQVKSVVESCGLFGDTVYITLEDGSKITAKSENVNSDDLSIIRINKNNFISPKINSDGKLLESTKELREWLLAHGITEGDLERYSQIIKIYEDRIYPGVHTPERYYSNYSKKFCYSYSSKPLVLKEQEIDQVLNGIEDEELREKIRCILFSDVFNKTR